MSRVITGKGRKKRAVVRKKTTRSKAPSRAETKQLLAKVMRVNLAASTAKARLRKMVTPEMLARANLAQKAHMLIILTKGKPSQADIRLIRAIVAGVKTRDQLQAVMQRVHRAGESAALKGLDPDRAVLSILRPYLPIRMRIGRTPVSKLPKYIATLLKSDAAYRAFKRSPEKAMRAKGIDPKIVSSRTLSELVKQLKARLVAIEENPIPGPDDVMESVSNKYKESAAEWNFDHSSWAITKYESRVIVSRGARQEKDKEEMTATTKHFEKEGIGLGIEEVIREELVSVFYPSQPLVSMELIDIISGRMTPEAATRRKAVRGKAGRRRTARKKVVRKRVTRRSR
jgi:hypothetical protein